MARNVIPPRVLTNLQAARLARGWSQEKLGLHPEVRIEQGFISAFERHAALPTPAQAERLAKALGLTVETLMQPVPGANEQPESVAR